MMHIVHAPHEFPDEWSKSIFLTSPKASNSPATPWHHEAIGVLRQLGYDGVVFVPNRDTNSSDQSDHLEWELRAMHSADAIVYWLPPETESELDTRVTIELGRWIHSHNLFLGHPDNGQVAPYLDRMLREFPRPTVRYETLAETITAAAVSIGDGVLRSGGERKIPIQVWRAAFFKEWYHNLQCAGHRLDDAKVRWVYFLPDSTEVLAGVLWVKVWVEEESRYKDNEWIFGRTDLCATVLHPAPNGGPRRFEDLLAQEIVLIREFRPNARSRDGFVHELPSGSSAGKPNTPPTQVAADEVREETGLTLDVDRFVAVESRQAAATVSTHHVNLFMAALRPEEMNQAMNAAQQRVQLGNRDESELTTVEIHTFRDLIESTLVDWSTVGMVMKALYNLANDTGHKRPPSPDLRS